MKTSGRGSHSLAHATKSSAQVSVDRGNSARASQASWQWNAADTMVVFVICQTEEQQHSFSGTHLMRSLTTHGIRSPSRKQVL